jgi:hypothetical protein
MLRSCSERGGEVAKSRVVVLALFDDKTVVLDRKLGVRSSGVVGGQEQHQTQAWVT